MKFCTYAIDGTVCCLLSMATVISFVGGLIERRWDMIGFAVLASIFTAAVIYISVGSCRDFFCDTEEKP